MKKLLIFILFALLAISGQAMAYSLSINPAAQSMGVGGSAAINLDMIIGANEMLQGFDLTLGFDNAILAFDNLASSTIGDTNFDFISGFSDNGSSVDISGFFVGLTPLTNYTVTLASLSFFGNTPGTSALSFSGTVLDALSPAESSLAAAIGSIDVLAPSAPVPEPGTFMLLAAGLASLVFIRRKAGAK